MDWLPALDLSLFRFVNQTLANPAFDWLMPRLSGHPLFVPILLAVAAWLICRGGARGIHERTAINTRRASGSGRCPVFFDRG